MLESAPSSLARTDIDRLRRLPEFVELPQALAHPDVIADDPAMLPRQIAERTLKRTRQLAPGFDQALEIIFGGLHGRFGSTLNLRFLRMRCRGSAGAPAEDHGLG